MKLISATPALGPNTPGARQILFNSNSWDYNQKNDREFQLQNSALHHGFVSDNCQNAAILYWCPTVITEYI